VKRQIAFLDVFAERPLTGNGLAVVSDADRLSDEAMLAFALETRLSETTFVQSSAADGADYRNRIWTPGEELRFAGHPSLGTAVAIARWRGQQQGEFVQETGAGLQPVRVRREAGPDRAGGERWSATMLQAPTEWGPELDPEATMRAAGLDPGDAHQELPPRVVSTGIPHLIAPLATREALARVEPGYEAVDALLAPHEAVVLYLAWCDAEAARAWARGFARILLLGEDPATGSAAGPLCAYLAERGLADAITVSQGEEMGRPSILEARIEDGRARVSGSVVPLVDGTVRLPETLADRAAS
jgi:trans-2,3-dihydro-3-hydroxyanthranilate isomerase